MSQEIFFIYDTKTFAVDHCTDYMIDKPSQAKILVRLQSVHDKISTVYRAGDAVAVSGVKCDAWSCIRFKSRRLGSRDLLGT